MKIKQFKIPKIEDFNLKEPHNLIREFVESVSKQYEALILWGLEQMGITPDGYPENLKRVKIYRDKWGTNAHIYIDNYYVFSVVCEPKTINPERYGVELYWRIKVLDELIGISEWRDEE